ncbi:hypothetical protein P280DRAFT_553688 [Massarina eburnea CBS 473.64]|uniref:Rhodopsin domain-containing protein n=1 Tax=Massarina eburnea CBS 473.64 TaxID=1395130 RepID=A0A6A6RKC2_9PLEO|nr:hypothetical protein P280DRAFT_553688 [Massarina eburnea CBS 473.64]
MYDGVVETIERRRTASMGDRGNVLNIVSWLLLVWSMCTLVARFCMKLSIKDKSKRFGWDDLLILFAAIFSIGHTIATSIESFQVLGQERKDLDANQLTIYQKAEYVSCMLYIANMGCARMSLCALIKKVLPGRIPRSTACVFIWFTLLWTASGVLVVTFHCSLPHPWKFLGNSKCIDIVKWVNYVCITNIVVEVLLVMIPLIVWNLRTSAGKRLSVSLLFLTRLSIVAAVSAQLYFFNQGHFAASEYWRTVLCIQVAQNLSIITACLPCLHPFIINVLGGAVQTEKIRYHYPKTCFIWRFWDKFGCGTTASGKDYDPMSSQSSGVPMREKNDKKEASEYCRPLATYGLDRLSAHLNSQHFNRSPLVVSDPESPPPQDVFMAPVQIPSYSRPTTPHSWAPSQTRNAASHSRSNSRKASKSRVHPRRPSDAPEIPQTLSDVGVLPLIDWDTDSSDRGSGQSNVSRRPNSEYVFHRSKVISVPEESYLREGQEEYYKKYYPPLPSPRTPKKPPRNF